MGYNYYLSYSAYLSSSNVSSPSLFLSTRIIFWTAMTIYPVIDRDTNKWSTITLFLILCKGLETSLCWGPQWKISGGLPCPNWTLFNRIDLYNNIVMYVQLGIEESHLGCFIDVNSIMSYDFRVLREYLHKLTATTVRPAIPARICHPKKNVTSHAYYKLGILLYHKMRLMYNWPSHLCYI